jgi:hypothetical protein
MPERKICQDNFQGGAVFDSGRKKGDESEK